MPLLNDIDKLWLSFQLVCAVVQIHSEGFYHGDIKPANVLLTSWDWIFLTDFAPYKPVYLPSESWGDYQFFFARASTKIIGCYVAPEKFVPAEANSNVASLKALQVMDVFSLGCVLAEIYLEGNMLFDLPKLQDYKKAAHQPTALLNTIENEAMREMIGSMISINPAQRKSAKEYLDMMVKKIVPPSFVQFTYYFFVSMMHPALSSSDRKVAAVFTHLHAIWKCCFNSEPPEISQSLSSIVFESVREVPFGKVVSEIVPKGFSYCVKYEGLDKILVGSIFENEVSKEMQLIFCVTR
eukprot:TRINITY_DN13940_c0_g1_i4.p1 TRINITY_DN13940_c0_g1~~TRINITY_DN13940_c0_g1_i4.p1  ORF type:complete len:296 (-),score=76.97 TRINITY_DN13940_c0_g1_i4:54-941(-)